MLPSLRWSVTVVANHTQREICVGVWVGRSLLDESWRGGLDEAQHWRGSDEVAVLAVYPCNSARQAVFLAEDIGGDRALLDTCCTPIRELTHYRLLAREP